jgi:hypothetical protein
MRPLLLAAAAGLTAPARPAAAQESVNLTLSWLEVIAGTNAPVPNPNGTLEPGEAVRFSISVLVTPPIGSTSTYPPPPLPGTGTLAGFAPLPLTCLQPVRNAVRRRSGFVELDFARPRLGLGRAGSPSGSGWAFAFIQTGQFVTPGMTANSSNPIPNIWQGVWTPSVFSGRSVSWTLSPSPLGSPNF